MAKTKAKQADITTDPAHFGREAGTSHLKQGKPSDGPVAPATDKGRVRSTSQTRRAGNSHLL